MNILHRLLAYAQNLQSFNKGSDEENEIFALFEQFLSGLESGAITCVQKNSDNNWLVNQDVKRAILLGFKLGKLKATGDDLSFVDKHTYPIRKFTAQERVRIVPGGSSVRRGSYLGSGVTMMPPAYVNVGAFVDSGTMIDSHALVGSCAYIGKNVHLSAAAQIGGVLEPIGAMPVIIEDDAFIGGNVGVYEGTIIRKRAILAAGVILTKSTAIFDIPNQKIIRSIDNEPLQVPENAVVVPGSRPAKGEFAINHGLNINTPIIIKYRDEHSDNKTNLEEILRS